MDQYTNYGGRGNKYEPYPREYDYPRVFRSNREYDDQISGSYDPRSKMSKSGDSEPDSDQERSLKNVCGEFAEVTSVQGVIFIAHANKMWLKIIWLIIFLGSCGAMIFHLYYLSNVFFLYPKQSKIELGFDGLSFPAITVCNINPIRASMLQESGSMMEVLMETTSTANQIDHLTGQGDAEPTADAKRRRKRYLDDLSVNYTNSYSEYVEDMEDYDDKWAKEAPRTTEAKIEEEFTALFSDMRRDKRVRLGHQLKDFMVQSSFSGRKVPNNNYNTLPSMTYGNCFTLQYNDFISRKGGPTDGFEAILFLENDEYIRGWTNGNGAHIVLHDTNTVPLIEKDGIAIAGGTETFIGIKRINIGRLGQPHGFCDDGSYFKTKFQLTYTRQACQDYCQVRVYVDQCNCTDGRLDELNRTFKLNDTNHECRSNPEIKCLIKWQRKYEFGETSTSCSCLSPCTETKFEKSISSRQWPSVEYGRVLVQAMCARVSDEKCNKLKDYDGFELSQNFIKLNIYYEDLNYENITEAEDYETAQYLSDIGGTLGLWIGLSAISIFEIGQLICQCCGVCCRSKNKRSDKRVEPRMRRDNVLPERVAYMSNPKAGYPSSDLGSYHLNRRH